MISTGRDTYMTIWSVEEKDGKYRGRASTSRKNKQTNEYQNSNWNVSFVGAAAEKAATLAEKDRIVIKAGDLSIENIFLPENGDRKATTFLRVTIFDFEKQSAQNNATPNVQPANSDELPF